MKIEDFVTTYHNRAPQLMWFLGAGSSAAAGIPTAGDMIWDFKRTIYCAAQKVSLRSISDIANPAIRTKIQQYLDSTGQYPPADSLEEYAEYFEKVHRTEADRRRYIDRLVSSGSPSYGHLALAALLKLKKAQIIWTTNFDRTVEDATGRLFGTSGRLTVSTLDTPQVAQEAIGESRFPLLIKPHGDFQSRKLKNTSPELQQQDSDLRQALEDQCKAKGLVVVGYSGRDESIMKCLENAIAGGKGFPAGLFWIQRSDSYTFLRVSQLISKAKELGIDAHIVKAETFDELLSDLINLLPELPQEIAQELENKARRVSNAPLPEAASGNYPLLRLNALPILSAPTTCRRVLCDIGGYADIRQAIQSSSAQIIAARKKVGVLAFGRDSEMRRTFEAFKIQEFDLHPIEPKRLRYESAELGLVYEALCSALVRELPLLQQKRKGHYVLRFDPQRAKDADRSPVKSVPSKTGPTPLSGVIPKTSIPWEQAVKIKIEYRIDRLWLLLEPTIWMQIADETPEDHRYIASDFIREALATRYNGTWNSFLNAWIEVIVGANESRIFRCFGIEDGVDANFTLGRTSAHSFRERSTR